MGLGMKAESPNKLKLLKTTLDKWTEIVYSMHRRIVTL